MSDIDNLESIQDSPIPKDLTRFTRGPSTVKGLIGRAEAVESHFKEFNNRLARAEIDLGTRIDKKRAEIESLKDTLSPDQRRQSLEKAMSTIRREATAASDKGRWEVLRLMAAAEAEILAVESQFATPAHILARAGLGSEERSRYLSQIETSGPLEIQNFAAHAVATGDKVLGAALLSRLDRMGKRERELSGVSRQQLSQALAGAEYKDAQAAIQRTKNRLREAMANNRAFESGRAVSVKDKIGLALNRSKEEGASDGG